jgi:hypothetical protein
MTVDCFHVLGEISNHKEIGIDDRLARALTCKIVEKL